MCEAESGGERYHGGEGTEAKRAEQLVAGSAPSGQVGIVDFTYGAGDLTIKTAQSLPVLQYGQSITFRGVDIRIDGNPASGDSFTVAPAGNRDVFAMLDDLVAALQAPAATGAQRAQLHSNIGQRIADMDSALSHIIDVRGEIGTRVRALDQQDSLSADFALHLNTTLSSVRDLDYADALSRLQKEMFGLDAAQQTFARTQDLSLFKYI